MAICQNGTYVLKYKKNYSINLESYKLYFGAFLFF